MKIARVGFETSESAPQLIYQLSYEGNPFNQPTQAISITRMAQTLSEFILTNHFDWFSKTCSISSSVNQLKVKMEPQPRNFWYGQNHPTPWPEAARWGENSKMLSVKFHPNIMLHQIDEISHTNKRFLSVFIFNCSLTYSVPPSCFYPIFQRFNDRKISPNPGENPPINKWRLNWQEWNVFHIDKGSEWI